MNTSLTTTVRSPGFSSAPLGTSRSLFAPQETGAVFSPCRRYRYRLWRVWDATRPLAVYILLNPSIANEVDPDPTETRCLRRAAQLGYGGIVIVNLFAFVSTDPAGLKTADDPVGEHNDLHIFDAVRQTQDLGMLVMQGQAGADTNLPPPSRGIVICGWGTHLPRMQHADGTARRRDLEVLEVLRRADVTPMCLARTKAGHPKHPLYVGYDVKPMPYVGTVE